MGSTLGYRPPAPEAILTGYGCLCDVLTGKCPVSPALEGGVKGHNIEGKYLTGKPRPLGRGASLR